MKAIVVLTLCALTLNAGAQQTKSQTVTVPVESVILYLDGAEITSVKTVNLSAGRNEVIFEGISSRLNPASIQVKAGTGSSLLSISHRTNFLSLKKESARIMQLRDSIDLLNLRITAINDERDAYTAEKNMIINNQQIGGQNNGVTAAELKATADLFRTRIKEINNKLSELALKATQINPQLSRLNNELGSLNARDNVVNENIIVLLNTSQAGPTEIELKYLVTDAGWAPSYDLKAEDIDQPIDLKYSAKVFNNTNVDWTDVKLKLSTADPTLSASKPEVKPWFVDFTYQTNYNYQQSNYNYNSNMPANSNDKSQSQTYYDYSGRRMEQRGNITYEEIEVSQLSAEFEIKNKYSVPSDAKPYLVEVTEHKLPATYKHYCAPKVDRDAFLLARITGWEELNLVEGPANVYFGGTYVGQSYIQPRSVDDTLDLSLGRDKKIIVTRTKQKDFTNNRVSGSNKRDSYGYEYMVKNNRKAPVNIDIIDQIPVSRNNEITVEVINISKAKKDDATGLLTWSLRVEPGQVEKFQLSFAIRYPKSKSINGGEGKYKKMRAKFNP